MPPRATIEPNEEPSMNPENAVVSTELHLIGIHELRKRWGWFLALGIFLILLGMIALGSSVFMTLATMVFVGWLMIVSGVFQAVHAFTCKGWSGFFIDMLTGLLYAVVGFMIVANPAATAITLTLLIAMVLIFSGIFRIVVALSVRYQNSLWLVLHGVI